MAERFIIVLAKQENVCFRDYRAYGVWATSFEEAVTELENSGFLEDGEAVDWEFEEHRYHPEKISLILEHYWDR
jgi:hypothetical protein